MASTLGRPYRPKRPRPLTAKTVMPLYARRPGRGIRSPVKVTKPKTVKPAGSTTTPKATKTAPAVFSPYAMYADPAQRALLEGIDADQKNAQAYAAQTGQWLGGALTNLTGVDPAHLGINPTMQQQYLANINGVVGGALNAAAAGAAGPAITPTTPGGIAASPTSYLSGAAIQGDYGRASGAMQAAQAQSALNTLQPNTQAQAYVYQLAALQAGLPAVYAQNRADARTKIDQFNQQAAAEAAKVEETNRHNRVTEAISATNAQTNAAFQASRLGLSAQGQGFDQATQTTAAATPAPAGYLRDPATGKLYRDPSVPNASSAGTGAGGRRPTSTRDVQGRYLYPSEHGFTIGGWKVRPKGIKNPVTQGADGKWYAKPGKGAAAPSATQVAKAQGTEPNKVYDKVNGYVIQGAIADDQSTGTGDLLRILRSLQPTDKKNFAKWYASIVPVLRRIDPRYEEWMTGYIKRRKTGSGGVGWSGKL